MTELWKDVHEEFMQDPEYREEWERTKPFREIANEIVRVRTEAKLTQRQLAEKIGTSYSTICRIESLEYGRVTFSTLVRIAQALGLELEVRFKKAS